MGANDLELPVTRLVYVLLLPASAFPAKPCRCHGLSLVVPRQACFVLLPRCPFCRCQDHQIQGCKTASVDSFFQVPRPAKTKTETSSNMSVFGIVKTTSSLTMFC
uniref:Uncharacterized protein n=1 Tax=Triticum urartu TaxID=4572 RepID=A0A8R7U784_TRIUA